MKKVTWMVLLVLAGALSAASAFAEDQPVIANVPFAFSVGNKVLPAGRYEVTSVGNDRITGGVLIRNVDQPRYAALTFTAQAEQTPVSSYKRENAGLVFVRINDQYFLREIRGSVDAVGLKLPVTKAEKSATRTVALLPGTTASGSGQ